MSKDNETKYQALKKEAAELNIDITHCGNKDIECVKKAIADSQSTLKDFIQKDTRTPSL